MTSVTERQVETVASAPPRASRPRRRVSGAGPWTIAVLVAVVVLAPVVALVLGAFSTDVPNAPDARLTLDNVRAVFSGAVGQQTVRDIWHSLVLSLAATVLATVLGAGIAWLVVRTDLPGRRLLQRAMMLPMFYSVVLNVVGWIMLGQESSGYINAIWRGITGGHGHLINIYSFAGMVWVMGVYFMPYAMTIAASSFERGNASLEEAASVAGASPWTRFRLITLPMASPGLAAAALFVFALSLEQFVTPAFLGTQIHFGTLAYRIYILNRGYPSSPEQSAVISIILVALTTLGLLLFRRMTRHEQKYIAVGGKGQKPSILALGRWRWVAFGGTCLVLLITVLAPLAAVVLRAFMQARTDSIFSTHFGWQNFRGLTSGSNFRTDLINSIVLAVGGAVICTLLGLFLAYWVVRRRSGATAFADYVISLPLGIPGVAFGVGMLWAFVATPIYLTLWILLLTYVLRYAVYGVRTASTGLGQLDPALEEAAMVSGASRLKTTAWIIAPLLKGSLASSWLLVFLLVFQELSATIILYGPSTSTLSVDVFNSLNSGFYGPASALAVVQLAIIAVLVALFSRAFRVRMSAGLGA